jgi:hypothetical protein
MDSPDSVRNENKDHDTQMLDSWQTPRWEISLLSQLSGWFQRSAISFQRSAFGEAYHLV